MVTVPLTIAWHAAAAGLALLASTEVARSNALRGVVEFRRTRREHDEVAAFMAGRSLPGPVVLAG